MDTITDIAQRIAERHSLPIRFILDLLELERDRVTQLRRKGITSDIRDLLKNVYWEESVKLDN